MKQIKLHLKLPNYLYGLVLLITSCIPPINDIPDDPRKFDPPNTNLLELGSSLPYFKDYLKAMDQTNLSNILEYSGPYTVFMPNQNAFMNFRSELNISSTDELPDETLRDILLYHIIHGDWILSSIPDDYYPTLARERTTGNPISLYIVNTPIFRINGILALDEPDLRSVNGTIHSIDAVIRIPTVLTHLSINEEFSIIYELLQKEGLEIDGSTLLTEEGPITLLAPSNDAILTWVERNEFWQTPDDIPNEVIGRLFENHLIEDENLLSTDFIEDRKFLTMI
jgi:uncharacterized surface protein with fasciclin (FAS1) repeats